MINGAGILFVTPEKQALFLKRGPGGDHPGEWCFPGGHIEDGETAEDAAKREAVEEIGFLPDGDVKPWVRCITPPALDIENGAASVEPVDFTTFLQGVPAVFEPVLNGEHVGWAWAPIDQPPEPLHPACYVALSKFSMDELGLAKAIRDGQLTSPQRYENISLFDIRITGTGTAYRKALDEFVYRRPENYLTPEFLERCNGLPVIVDHPDSNVLDSEEYATRNVGSVFIPYIKNDEVWAIVKIYDADFAEKMADDQLSTSPSVVFRDPDLNEKMTLESGSTLLIEGKPSLLDHIAICDVGVWDKGGSPAGVVSAEIRGDSVMPSEEERIAAEKARKDADEKERDERSKADAEAGDKLDKVLDALTSVSKRLDALEDGKKADKAKGDAEEEPGKPERVAADKGRKDAEEEEAKVKAKADAEEKEKAKADADEMRKKIDELEAKIPKAVGDADYAAMADAQAKADSVYSAFGDSAPRPLQGEDLLSYRRRLATGLKGHSANWKGVDLSALSADVVSVAEGQIYADAATSARRPTNLAAGSVRAIKHTDSAGHTVVEYVGDSAALFDAFSHRRQAVTAFVRNPGAN